ncbi:hypothetical protein C8J35_104136 [Rhizobium sp. PP-F2F-G38]|nr:hypothetical protein C8J35_104136 [Rhizobium sp. PP-F2F-G38]
MTRLDSAPQATGLPPADGTARHCRTCTLCCRLPDIDALDKPANAWCRHCVAERGCTIYAERPALCRDFLCAWMTKPDLEPEWDPLVAHMMVYEQGPQTTVLVDPDYPTIWQQAPYKGLLERWAAQAEARGGYIIVFVGDDVFKVEPAQT